MKNQEKIPPRKTLKSKLFRYVDQKLPPPFKTLSQSAALKVFGFLRVPIIFFVGPRVVVLNDDRCELEIPFTKRNKNHWGSIYLGALTVGADCVCGVIAMHHIEKQAPGMNIIFKDMDAKFYKRVEGTALLSCNDGVLIRQAVTRAMTTGLRQNVTTHITVKVPDKLGHDVIAAEYHMTLSIK